MKNTNPGIAYEPHGLNVRALAAVGVAVLLSGILIALVASVTFSTFAKSLARAGLHASTVVHEENMSKPPEPRLQVDPTKDLRALQKQEADTLGSYGWVDRDKGIVRIPIEQAMKLVVERQK